MNIEEEVASLPPHLQEELMDYLAFLKFKAQQHAKKTEVRWGFGMWKGKIKMADDFDAPLDDFKDYM